MIATAVRAREVKPEQLITIYELLTVWRVYCRSYPKRGWVARCLVNGKVVEAEGDAAVEGPISAVYNLRDKVEDATTLAAGKRSHGIAG